jgi:Na+/H+-translocating membrane pyrophosphatase
LIELGFIVALEIGGFVLTLTMARAAGLEPGAAVYRVVSAVERALRSFLGRERQALAGAGLLVLAAVVALHALVGRVALALLVAAGLVVGVLLTLAFAALSASSTGRAAGSVHASARVGFNPALSVALRVGGAIGLGAETASTLGALALFGVAYLAEGGRASGGTPESLESPCLVVVGYAMGAALAALVVERAGSAYQVGAEAGKGRGAVDAAGDANDPRNPALVASLVGDHVGSVAAASAATFALSAVATAALFVCARSIGKTPDEEFHAAALPLAIRSFGVVACAAGVLAARADEAQGQGLALLRGLACAVAISLFGIAGGSYWLVEQNFWFFAVAGAFGLAAAALPALVALSFTDRGARPLRSAVEALRDGASASFGSSIGYALERSVVPLAFAVVFAMVARALGERAEASGGARLGAAVFALSLIGLAPYALAALGMSAVARSARSITALSKVDAESAWRLQRLDDVGFAAAAPARALLFTAGAFAVLPGVAIALGTFDGASGLGPSGTMLCALIGSVIVLGHAGQAARAASRTADEVTLEVERQIGGTTAGGAGPASGAGAPGALTEGHAPSYRACEELTQKAASAGLLLGASWAVAPLVLLGIGLGLVYRVGGSRLAAAAVSTIVATAAVTALGAALAVDGARTVHGGARRLARHERETASRAAPNAEDVLANILGIAAGPGASSQALLLASFALLALELIP